MAEVTPLRTLRYDPSAVGSLDFPSGAVATIGLVLGWFILGFFFYASLFAVAGSIVTRQEDLQTTMTPLTILPFSSPLVMPTRIALGEAATWEVVASVAISVGATAAVIPIATTIYSRALLRPGRVRIRQVLRPDAG